MRIMDLAKAAAVGGVIGFAASHIVVDAAKDGADSGPDIAALVDARVEAAVDARMADLGLASATDLDSRISGGVAQFLADQPEAVMTALEQHQVNEKAREEDARKETLASLGDALTRQPGDPAIGASAETAEVTLVEFFDYRCGYCKRSLETVLDLAKEDPTLRVVFKEFPILGPESVAATQVSLAANLVDPSRYDALHNALMRHSGAYDKATLLGVAAKVGYDPVEIEAALANGAIGAQIRNGYEIAEALGIRGTPAFIVGSTVIPGAVSGQRLREAIEAARAEG